ncbi:MAG: hypothetical protein DI534_12510 [Leifsonia xyli]|nr:MAG: hypothetical protein DI534_12510 [Leifsonia xyli]
MTAGESAGLEAERQLALAAAHEAEALAAHGYHLIADRQWPGSRTAQVDLVVVGPSGVHIVDSTMWREVAIAAGHIFRGDADVTEELDGTRGRRSRGWRANPHDARSVNIVESLPPLGTPMPSNRS